MSPWAFGALAFAALGFVAAASSGCPGDEPPADASTPLDGAARVDAREVRDGASGPCATARHVALSLEAPTAIMGDLGASAERVELSDACGYEGAAPPRAEILALEVPGTGSVGVGVRLRAEVPSASLLVAEARTICEAIPTSLTSCFDEIGGRAPGVDGFVAAGGSTVYLVVAGEGAYALELTAEPSSAPVLATSSARRVLGADVDVFVSGVDADANLAGLGVQWLGTDGAIVPRSSARPTELGPYLVAFGDGSEGPAFERWRVSFEAGPEADGIEAAYAARVFVYDRFGARSATREMRIEDARYVGFGEPCDEARVCRASNVCEDGVCAASEALTALCGAATPLALEAPVDGGEGEGLPLQVERFVLPSGSGVVDHVSCGVASGRELVLALELPEGAYDLVVRTDLDENEPSLDTLLSIRERCASDASELACGDDRISGDALERRASLVLEGAPAGPLSLFVDVASPLSAATELAVGFALRPIREAGSACDPAGVLDRCSAEACSPGGICP